MTGGDASGRQRKVVGRFEVILRLGEILIYYPKNVRRYIVLKRKGVPIDNVIFNSDKF